MFHQPGMVFVFKLGAGLSQRIKSEPNHPTTLLHQGDNQFTLAALSPDINTMMAKQYQGSKYTVVLTLLFAALFLIFPVKFSLKSFVIQEIMHLFAVALKLILKCVNILAQNHSICHVLHESLLSAGYSCAFLQEGNKSNQSSSIG